MSLSHTRFSLRNVLLLDAATCVAMGVALAVAARPIAAATELPAPLLSWAGLSLLPIGALMAFAATRPVIRRGAVWFLIAGNLLWIDASVLLLVLDWATPNSLGTALVAGQALATAVLAGLELVALRGSGHALQPARR
jgi:hypothetical protein